MKQFFYILLTVCLSALLPACGSDASLLSDTEQTLEKRGYGEVELYDPVNNPDGAYLPAGSTAVLFLEAPETDAIVGDTGSVGEDSVWLDLQLGGYLGLELEEADLEVIDRAQLIDSNGEILIEVNDVKRSGDITIPAGKYVIAFHAAHSEANPQPLFIGFEESEVEGTAAATTERWDWWDVTALRMSFNCPNCDLSGADLRGEGLAERDLSSANLTSANLSGATMGGVNLSGARMTGANLSGARMGGSNLSGADLSGANLTLTDLFRKNVYGDDGHGGPQSVDIVLLSSNLSGANLRGATLMGATLNTCNLTRADLSFANLSGANLTGANLSGATIAGATLDGTNFSDVTWPDGRICAEESIGVCK